MWRHPSALPPRARNRPPPTPYTRSVHPPTPPPFSPSSTYVAFLKSSPRYRRRVDEIGTLIKLLLGAVEQPRLAASKRQPADRTYDGNGSTAPLPSTPRRLTMLILIISGEPVGPEPKSRPTLSFADTYHSGWACFFKRALLSLFLPLSFLFLFLIFARACFHRSTVLLKFQNLVSSRHDSREKQSYVIDFHNAQLTRA